MCKHDKDHKVECKVACLEDTGGFMFEVRVTCAECGKPFQFLGLPPGLNLQGATVSIDGQELNIAICPFDAKPNPMQKMMGYTINRHN